MKGIDVSSHNGVIDWAKVKSAGIEFAILRAGYGKFENQVDKTFVANATGALAAGLHVGAYWFSYAITAEDARKEAQLFAKQLEPYKKKFDFPVYFDYEYDSENYSARNGVTPTATLRESLVKAFCDEIQARGWRAGVYTNMDYLKNRWRIEALDEWELWLADYTGNPDVECGMQQTGSTGKVNGISGNVDMNTAFADYPSLMKHDGWNGWTVAANWISDTTNGTDNPVIISPDAHYTVKITGQDIDLVCGESGGKPAAFRLVRCRREGEATFWHVIPVGASGQEAGIYPKSGGDRIFVAKIK